MAMIENVVPILRVGDLAVSRRFYVDILGFTADWDAGAIISVSRDGKSIMICEGAQGRARNMALGRRGERGGSVRRIQCERRRRPKPAAKLLLVL
jgi:catechol 2,3-dioxygenase-like lactoylglutathione lyase family enzyme